MAYTATDPWMGTDAWGDVVNTNAVKMGANRILTVYLGSPSTTTPKATTVSAVYLGKVKVWP